MFNTKTNKELLIRLLQESINIGVPVLCETASRELFEIESVGRVWSMGNPYIVLAVRKSDKGLST